jgi:hypothetical protein
LRAAPPAPAPAPAPAAVAAPPAEGGLKANLIKALRDAALTFEADAAEHAEVAETANELILTGPKADHFILGSSELQKVAARVLGRPVKVILKEGAAAAPVAPERPPADVEAAAERALSHPDVQRFRELFPDGQVRQVRDLKE